MRTYQQWRNYKELELICTSEPKFGAHNLTVLSFFNKVWREVQAILTLSNEPWIWETTDRKGKTRWNIYDPVSDQSFQLSSEQEVLIWLEERHSPGLSSSSWDL